MLDQLHPDTEEENRMLTPTQCECKISVSEKVREKIHARMLRILAMHEEKMGMLWTFCLITLLTDHLSKVQNLETSGAKVANPEVLAFPLIHFYGYS